MTIDVWSALHVVSSAPAALRVVFCHTSSSSHITIRATRINPAPSFPHGQIYSTMDVEESPWADTGRNSQQTSQTDAGSSEPSTSQAASSAPRPSRGPRRLVAQPTRLEAVEDPLGPLSAAADDNDGASDAPPVPPQKEQMVIRTTMPQQQQQPRRPIDPHHVDDDDEYKGPGGPRAPPPVDAARPSSVRSNTQPSVSIEQASKPSFQITVGDPVKIGDLTSSHIVYSVRTKVRYT